MAGLLLSLSWPRLRASLTFLPVDTALSNYKETLEIDTAQLGGLIERAEQAIEIHDHYRYWGGLSELQILRSQDANLSIWQRREALEKSIAAAERALERAPAKPRTWLRIARTRDFLAYPAVEVIPALKMSILTGRVEPTLMLARLELGLRNLPNLDDEGVRLIRDQAVLTWNTQRRDMIKAMRSGSLNPGMLREVLSDHNQAIILEMEAQLEK